MVSDFAEAEAFGIKDVAFTLDFPAVMERKRAVVKQLRDGVESLISNPNIHLLRGEARFVDALTVEAAGERVTAKDVIVATGSSSAMLPIDGNTLEGVLTSREPARHRQRAAKAMHSGCGRNRAGICFGVQRIRQRGDGA